MTALTDLQEQTGTATEALPEIVDASVFTATPMPEPPQVVCGVLHRGSKAVYGGPSKAFKSWTLLDLCLAVSTGGDWLGFETTAGPVLYMNFELQPFAVHKRLLAIAHDRGCAIPPTLRLWNLRGFARPLSLLLPELMRQIRGEGYALLVPDPIYKTLNGRDENSAGDIGDLCGELDAVAVDTGAAVAFGAHFAKGNASGKEHIDRVSGSGVWARDPDAIITATTHEEDSAFAVEMTLRNFPPVEPFVIRWDYPRMRRDDGADPSRLKAMRGTKVARQPVEDFADRAVEIVKDKALATPIFRAKLQRLTETRDRARELVNLLVAEGRLAELHERGKGKHEALIGTPEQIAEMRQKRFTDV